MRMLLCALAATLSGAMAPSAGEEARYTVFAELRAPYESNQASLQRIYRRVAASSRPGMIEQPFLEGASIPPRLARYIRSVYFDPQRS